MPKNDNFLGHVLTHLEIGRVLNVKRISILMRHTGSIQIECLVINVLFSRNGPKNCVKTISNFYQLIVDLYQNLLFSKMCMRHAAQQCY